MSFREFLRDLYRRFRRNRVDDSGEIVRLVRLHRTHDELPLPGSLPSRWSAPPPLSPALQPLSRSLLVLRRRFAELDISAIEPLIVEEPIVLLPVRRAYRRRLSPRPIFDPHFGSPLFMRAPIADLLEFMKHVGTRVERELERTPRNEKEARLLEYKQLVRLRLREIHVTINSLERVLTPYATMNLWPLIEECRRRSTELPGFLEIEVTALRGVPPGEYRFVMNYFEEPDDIWRMDIQLFDDGTIAVIASGDRLRLKPGPFLALRICLCGRPQEPACSSFISFQELVDNFYIQLANDDTGIFLALTTYWRSSM